MKDDSNIRMTLGIMGWVLFVILYISIFIFFKPVGYVEDLETQLSKCQEQDDISTTFSYWQKGDEYNNYVCVGDFYINGDKVEIPKVLERLEVGFWNRTIEVIE